MAVATDWAHRRGAEHEGRVCQDAKCREMAEERARGLLKVMESSGVAGRGPGVAGRVCGRGERALIRVQLSLMRVQLRRHPLLMSNTPPGPN